MAFLARVGDLISPALTPFVLGVFILVIGVVMGQAIEKLVIKIARVMKINRYAKKVGVHVALERGIAALLKFIIYTLALLLALQTVGLTRQVFNIVAIILFILVVAFILLGLRDFILNAVAGMALSWKKFIAVNNNITFRTIQGKVIERGVLQIRVKTKKGDTISIPNWLLLREPLQKNR